jgi:hypothetical protein
VQTIENYFHSTPLEKGTVEELLDAELSQRGGPAGVRRDRHSVTQSLMWLSRTMRLMCRLMVLLADDPDMTPSVAARQVRRGD